jgi:hypothetical protein
MIVFEGILFPFGGKRHDTGVGIRKSAEIYLGQGQGLRRITPQRDVELAAIDESLSQGGLAVALNHVGDTVSQFLPGVYHRIRPDTDTGILGNRFDDQGIK